MQVEENFVDIGSDMSVSQSSVDTAASDTSMDDLPEFEDVSFGDDEEDELDEVEEISDEAAAANAIFKDLDLDSDETKKENVSSEIDMSVFDDSVLEELELDESLSHRIWQYMSHQDLQRLQRLPMELRRLSLTRRMSRSRF